MFSVWRGEDTIKCWFLWRGEAQLSVEEVMVRPLQQREKLMWGFFQEAQERPKRSPISPQTNRCIFRVLHRALL